MTVSRQESALPEKTQPHTGDDRIVVLDGLRGAAILVVMTHHFFLDVASSDYDLKWQRWGSRLINSGWIGVDLFFVLSGFLITRSLLSTRSRPNYFLNFFTRRTLRIFPLYFGVLVLTLLIIPTLSESGKSYAGNSIPNQIWLWTYTTNFAVSKYQNWEMFHGSLFHMGHFWSLAVEEHFYIVWPFVVYYLSRRGLGTAAIMVAVAAAAARGWIFIQQGNDVLAPAIVSYCRIDSLAIGALAATATENISSKKLGFFSLWGTAMGAILLSILFFKEYGLRPSGSRLPILNFTLLALFFGSLLVATICFKDHRIVNWSLGNSVLVMLGKYSYGLYVYHGLIGGLFHNWIPVETVREYLPSLPLAVAARGLAWGIISLTLAYISWHLYEKRWLELKKYFQ